MNKKRTLIIITIILCFVFCGYPTATSVYGAQDRVTEKFENFDIAAPYCNYPDASKLPDVVVTYKDGVCTVKNLPAYKHPRLGRTEGYEYMGTGSAGVFLVIFQPENSPHPYKMRSYCLVDTNKTPVTAKLIESDEKDNPWDGQWYPNDIKILSNGVSAFLDSNTVILFRPDGSGRIRLIPPIPEDYKFWSHGVDYCAKSGQYAVVYELYPDPMYEAAYGFQAPDLAGVALFDESGKLVKNLPLDGLRIHDVFRPIAEDTGYNKLYFYCRFSADSNYLYASGLASKSLIQKSKNWSYDDWLKNDYEPYSCYKINLQDGSYKGISKLPESKPEFPFKIQYNKTGTYLYTKSGDTFTTLAFLDGDYVAASYSLNTDGSMQVIFMSDARIGHETHPMSK